jgi:glycosyltransferase involved in cell wall biosynthesis
MKQNREGVRVLPTPEPKMRVLLTADAVGGVWQYSIDLARELAGHGVQVAVAVLGPAPSPDRRRAAEDAGIDVQVTGLPLDWTAGSPDEVERAGLAVAELAARLGPDIVHLNTPALAAGARFPAPIVAMAHSCVATWWRAVKQGPLPDAFVWRAELTRRGYENADAVVAPSSAFAMATQDTYGLRTKPSVVRNGRRMPAASGMAEETFIFTAGRLWDEGKNIAMLDRAAARLPVPLVAAGPVEGPNGAGIHLRHLRPLGSVGDEAVAARLSHRPIFVSVARYEPFGLAVLEAAQAGCALVLSDIPTFRELWEGAATFVDPDDEDAIAGALDRLLGEPDSRAMLGRLARKRAAEYGAEAMGANMLALYRSSIARRTKTRKAEGVAA